MSDYVSVIDPYAAWGTTLLRVGLGIIFVAHGWRALIVIGPEAMASSIARLGYPGVSVLGWYVIVAHLAGGALLILGLWTRLVALVQVPIMAAAALQLRWWQGFFLTGTVTDASGQIGAGGYEYDLFILIATCSLALLGPGKAAIDNRPRFRVT